MLLLYITAENFDLENIRTPIDVSRLIKLLEQANYKPDAELRFLKEGFTEGFSIGYEGPTKRRDTAKNIPFTVGSKYDMWEKIMKELKEGRLAGPYTRIPFDNFIQSPIGLVPKSGGKTRLIFHLFYDFSDKEQDGSLNKFTPNQLCTVKYNDLDHAVRLCLKVSKVGEAATGTPSVFLSKSDLMSAFRMIPIKKQHWCWLVMKAEDPRNG